MMMRKHQWAEGKGALRIVDSGANFLSFPRHFTIPKDNTKIKCRVKQALINKCILKNMFHIKSAGENTIYVLCNLALLWISKFSSNEH